MATEISTETVEFVKAALKRHGFDTAIHKAGVDCIVKGIDADAYTYQLVALFTITILSQSMMSHNDPEKKFVTLRGNSAAMVAVIKSVTLQLAKQLDAEKLVADKVEVSANAGESQTTH